MIDITVMEESFGSWKERKEWEEWMERAVVGGVDSVDGVSSSGRVSELSALSVQHVDRPRLPPLSWLCSMPQSFGTRLYRDVRRSGDTGKDGSAR